MSMLVVSRHVGERVRLKLGETVVWLTCCDTQPGRMKLAIEAPPEVGIAREELLPPEERHARAARPPRGEEA
jgi:sRNA-binding carbon storage regulator CsrA